MESIDTSELEKMMKEFDEVARNFPRFRKKYHVRMAEMAQAAVRNAIQTAAHFDDTNGHISSWQEKYVGSRGGYAAVRPGAGKSGDNGEGAITNYLDGGHKVRGRKKKGVHGYHLIKKLHVAGSFFYSSAREVSERQAIEEAFRLADEIAEKLGG